MIQISSARLAKDNIRSRRRGESGLVLSDLLAKYAQLIKTLEVFSELDCALASAARSRVD